MASLKGLSHATISLRALPSILELKPQLFALVCKLKPNWAHELLVDIFDIWIKWVDHQHAGSGVLITAKPFNFMREPYALTSTSIFSTKEGEALPVRTEAYSEVSHSKAACIAVSVSNFAVSESMI